MKHAWTGAIAAVIASTSIAAAGAMNEVYLLQDSSAELGNIIFIDQSDAFGSRVAGNDSGVLPASQIGSGNSASLTLSGNGGRAVLNQNNLIVGGIAGNDATAVIVGLARGTINQFGDANSATLRVTGTLDGSDSASGTVNQFGSGNDANLKVEGRGASGVINQLGNHNTTALEVIGTGSSATFTQIGNNAVNPQGVTVVSNGGSVQITQFSF